MRIGIDARLYSTRYTGIGRYVKELVDHLLALDNRNEYILFFNEEEYNTYLPPNARVSKRRVKAPHYSLAEQTSFVTDLNREELDLAHFTHFNMPILYRKPSVVTIHDLTLTKFPPTDKGIVEKMAYTYTIRNSVKQANAVICISENTKEDAIKLLGADVRKIRVIYEGVAKEFTDEIDEGKRAALLERLRIDKPYFLYVGGFRLHKNLVNLVKAYNLFRNRIDPDSLLVLAGNPNPADPEIERAIHSLGLDTHVVRTGYVDDADLPELYSGARAFVFPSLYEGFGLPPLEAMTCGTPVVASSASCMPEILGEGAIYFNPQDIDDMAEKLGRVFTDEDVRTDLVAKGREQVKKYSWEKMAREVLAVYEEVAAKLPPKADPAAAGASPTPAV